MQLYNTMRNTPSDQHYRATLNHIPNILPPAQKHSSTLPPVHTLSLTLLITPLLKNIQTQIPIPRIPDSLSTFNPKKKKIYSKNQKKKKIYSRIARLNPNSNRNFFAGIQHNIEIRRNLPQINILQGNFIFC
jgi:hypothetical protein